MPNWQGSTRRQRLPHNWPQIRLAVLERDAWRCQLRYPHCVVIATDVDHIQHGDDHDLTNLQAACGPCHLAKSAREGGTANGARWRRPTEPHPGLRR